MYHLDEFLRQANIEPKQEYFYYYNTLLNLAIKNHNTSLTPYEFIRILQYGPLENFDELINLYTTIIRFPYYLTNSQIIQLTAHPNGAENLRMFIQYFKILSNIMFSHTEIIDICMSEFASNTLASLAQNLNSLLYNSFSKTHLLTLMFNKEFAAHKIKAVSAASQSLLNSGFNQDDIINIAFADKLCTRLIILKNYIDIAFPNNIIFTSQQMHNFINHENWNITFLVIDNNYYQFSELGLTLFDLTILVFYQCNEEVNFADIFEKYKKFIYYNIPKERIIEMAIQPNGWLNLEAEIPSVYTAEDRQQLNLRITYQQAKRHIEITDTPDIIFLKILCIENNITLEACEYYKKLKDTALKNNYEPFTPIEIIQIIKSDSMQTVKLIDKLYLKLIKKPMKLSKCALMLLTTQKNSYIKIRIFDDHFHQLKTLGFNKNQIFKICTNSDADLLTSKLNSLYQLLNDCKDKQQFLEIILVPEESIEHKLNLLSKAYSIVTNIFNINEITELLITTNGFSKLNCIANILESCTDYNLKKRHIFKILKQQNWEYIFNQLQENYTDLQFIERFGVDEMVKLSLLVSPEKDLFAIKNQYRSLLSQNFTRDYIMSELSNQSIRANAQCSIFASQDHPTNTSLTSGSNANSFINNRSQTARPQTNSPTPFSSLSESDINEIIQAIEGTSPKLS